MPRSAWFCATVLALAAGSSACAPGGATSSAPQGAVPAAFRGLGTEPFWRVEVRGKTLIYATPDSAARALDVVSRVDRSDETVLEATLEGSALVLTVRPEACSDGMSDRSYPYVATLRIGASERKGCALAL